MCGIAGTTELTPITREAMKFLAWEMEKRGRQSWGCTNGVEFHKALGPVTESFHFPEWAVDGDSFVLHTRAASTGAVTIENSHPFYCLRPGRDEASPDSWVVGVHNGIVSNHEDLQRRYNRNFSVDSQHIFAHIAENRSTAEISGYGALVWFDTPDLNEPRRLYLTRFNMQDLHVMELDTGEIIFASTDDPLARAIRMAGGVPGRSLRITNERLHFFDVDPNTERWVLYETNKQMPFGVRGRYNAATCVTEWGSTDDDAPFGIHRGYRRQTATTSRASGCASTTSGTGNADERTGHIANVGQRGRTANLCIVEECHGKVERRQSLLCAMHWLQLLKSCNSPSPNGELHVATNCP